jgi:hypothetical protein
MHWYNPKARGVEDVTAPKSDDEALQLLSGDPNSWKFVEQYVMLREEGMGVEQAVIFVGHHWRMFHLGFSRSVRK